MGIDTEFSPVMREALSQIDREILVIDIDDPEGPGGERLGGGHGESRHDESGMDVDV